MKPYYCQCISILLRSEYNILLKIYIKEIPITLIYASRFI